MRVVLQARHGEVDLEVVVHDPNASVADLAAALPSANRGTGGGLHLNGVLVAGTAGLIRSGLRSGCEIGLAGATVGRSLLREPQRGAEVSVVGGLNAGDRHPLAAGRSVLGRDPSCEVVLGARTTSNRHAVIELSPPGVSPPVASPPAVSPPAAAAAADITLADAGSTGGTWIDGRRCEGVSTLDGESLAALGAVLVRVTEPVWREPAILGRPNEDGCRPLHRPPPPALHPPAPAVTPPSKEPSPPGAPRFGWAAALVPLVGGLVLARLVDPRLALFTLLGPAVLVGQWIEERRRHRRGTSARRLSDQAGLAALAADIEAAGAAEAGRRWATHPDPSATGAEVEALGARLWSCRAGQPDFAEVTVGAAPALRWDPPTTGAAEGRAAAMLAEARLPHGCPALVPLRPGHHLGIAGPRGPSLAVARWVLLQLAARHGPADLRLAVVCAAGREGDWSWASFLPHTAASTSGGRRLLAAGPGPAGEVAEMLLAERAPHLVVMVDGEALTDPAAPMAGHADHRWSTLTIAPSRRALPSRCTTVLELDGPDGWGRLETGADAPQALLATGVSVATARRWACGLASLADPEADEGDASVPTSVRLLDLLGLDDPSPAALCRRWAAAQGSGLRVPLGCAGGRDGPTTVHLDLVADGPHALVAGTTGAGKSELLRSLVAGWTATFPPDRLALLLVDYKGGAAFAEAAQLPHVLGVVTDLGPDEAARALRSLEAELRRREAVLGQLGVRDIGAHPTHAGSSAPEGVEPMPRVVVVVDELAALVAELPTFLDSLLQLAARGRSLGLHLVLGTQRPGGVVSAAVRANCALRCCLRVPDEADALDVVGSTAPAHVDRRHPGRTFVRRGAGDLVEMQVGLVGGRRRSAGPAVTAVPASFGPDPAGEHGPAEAASSDLATLVDACCSAATESGRSRPRPLWLPPLPVGLDGTALPAQGDEVVIGIVDDPDRQRRLPLAWRPAEGPLLAIGGGAGPAPALRAVARALSARLDPGALHIYGFDLATQGLGALAGLPHVGALVRPGEQERLHRLIRRLTDELALRQAAATEVEVGAPGRPLVLVLVDGLASLRTALEDHRGLAALDALSRVVADGAPLGLVVAATADRPASVPAAWSAAASRRLAFRCGDPLDLLSLGAERVDQSRWPEGRCLDVASGLVAQVATGAWPAPADAEPGSERPGPSPGRALPRCSALGDLLAACPPVAGAEGLLLPVGVDGRDLGVAVARLRPGQAFVVCGPPGSGRTTSLAMLRRSVEAAGCQVVDAGPELPGQLAAADRSGGPPLVVVVDDAERVDDPGGTLAGLAAGRHPSAHLFAAARPDTLRAAFGHWTTDLRRSGAGLVLRPRSDLDGDVLGIALLPRWPVPLSGPGRAVLGVDGEAIPVQVALP